MAPRREELPLPTRPPYTAFIGNLAYDATEPDMAAFFGEHEIKSIKIVKTRDDRPKGFGYIEFATLDGLKGALARSGQNFANRTVRVGVAEPPKERNFGRRSEGGGQQPPSGVSDNNNGRRSTSRPLQSPGSQSGDSDGRPQRRSGFGGGDLTSGADGDTRAIESTFKPSEDNSLQEQDDDLSSVLPVESSPRDIPEIEARLYFAGLRGPSLPGPKLIFRTSSDVFKPPSGLHADRRLMKLCPVYEHLKLGENNLWESIRSETVKLLDQRDIKHSSIDLVRFTWLEDDQDSRTAYTTPITIWVGVLPDTLTGEVAHHSANDILGLLKNHGIIDIEISFREAVSRPSSGPELFSPVFNSDPLKDIIDPLTTALGLPIAGLRTLERQGMMGFYFRVGQDLYAVTARHILFPEDEGNNEYVHKGGPRKDVVLMGTTAFADFLDKIWTQIRVLNDMVELLEREEGMSTAMLQAGCPNAQEVVGGLEEIRRRLIKTQTKIAELEKLFVKVDKEWTKPADRVIGHVVWAPPISVATAPHSYTLDVCVVKLDKSKFQRNFRGNVLDLGPEIDLLKFMGLMYPRIGAASDFNYPVGRLLELRGILSKEATRKPTNKDSKGDLKHFVIKRSPTGSFTTIGFLSGFESHRRRYLGDATRDSVEAAIVPYYHGGPFSNGSGQFSTGGDSGSIIVDALGKFVALLTGGTGPTVSPDITFGTPMHWLWEVIKAKFEGANLYFDDDD